jgi:hypothetical protein
MDVLFQNQTSALLPFLGSHHAWHQPFDDGPLLLLPSTPSLLLRLLFFHFSPLNTTGNFAVFEAASCRR